MDIWDPGLLYYTCVAYFSVNYATHDNSCAGTVKQSSNIFSGLMMILMTSSSDKACQ